jgi:hypothetical protein
MCSDGYDDESPQFYFETRRRARKPRRCCECGRAIPSGETYVRKAGKWDGRTASYDTHLACEDLRDFIEEVVCGGHGHIYIGGLSDEIGEVGEYLDQDHDAWEEADQAVPNPMREVYDFICDSYPAHESPPRRPPKETDT